MTKTVKNYVIFQRILSIIYLILFVVPLVLGIIYLPKFLNDYLKPYQELLNNGQQGMGNFNSTLDILKQAQQMMNNK